jgi:uncharacterized lipoprotein YmbA
VAGCSFLPEAKPDPTRFFVLTVPAAAVGAAATAAAPAMTLRPVELAGYLRARPLVVRRGDNEIEFREFARWGEPLEQGIARILREELLARGVAGAVAMGAGRGLRGADEPALQVRVLACEGGSDGGVVFHAAWEWSPAPARPGAAPRGEFRAAGLRWDGRNEATLARALSEAVVALAAAIAGGAGA